MRHPVSLSLKFRQLVAAVSAVSALSALTALIPPLAGTAKDLEGPDSMGERSKDKLRVLNQDIVRNPRSAEAYVNRAVFYCSAFMEDEGLKDFDRALALDPKFYKAYEERGMSRMRQEEYKAALPDLLKAGALAPPGHKGPPYRNAGRTQIKLGAYSEAIKTLNIAISCETPQARHLSIKERAQCYLALGKYKEAMADVNGLEIDHRLGDERALTIRAEAEMHLGQHEKAIEDLTRALRKNRRASTNFEKAVFADGSARLYQLRAECYKKIGQNELASRDLKKSKTVENDSLQYAPFR